LVAPSFAVERCNSSDGMVVLRLRGELDLATASELSEQLGRAEHDARVVVIDLRGLEFMDSTGVALLASADRRARERGGRLVVVRGGRQVQRLFELTGLDGRLEIVDRDPGVSVTGDGAAPVLEPDRSTNGRAPGSFRPAELAHGHVGWRRA
jgi:anti-sigma B factor antagonist